MKKITIILILLIITAVFSFGEEPIVLDDPLFAPVLPEIIGQGGAFTANAHGYGALVTNPAGFSMKDGSFTLLTANAASYFVPTEDEIAALELLIGGDSDGMMEGVAALTNIITQNGIGANVNIGGFGIVGKGLGLGVIVDADTYGAGKTALGASFDGVVTATGIAGLSFKLGTDNFGLNIGGDVRFMHRLKMANVPLLDLLPKEGEEFAIDIYTGNALAIDLGAILQLGSLSVGASVRDFGGTQFNYIKQTMETVVDNPMASGSEPIDGAVYKIPMAGTLGVNFHPDFGALSFLIDPSFSLDYQHVFYAEDDNNTSFWTGVHAGTEIKVLRFMKVRAGINQGYVTAGVGAKLLFLDINASYFTREMGSFTGSQPNEGVVVEAAIRF